MERRARKPEAWGPLSVTYELQKPGQLAPNLWMGLAWKVEVQDSGAL